MTAILLPDNHTGSWPQYVRYTAILEQDRHIDARQPYWSMTAILKLVTQEYDRHIESSHTRAKRHTEAGPICSKMFPRTTFTVQSSRP